MFTPFFTPYGVVMSSNNATILKRFGVNLAKLRASKSLTQEQLADKANLDRMTIAFIEGGRRWPRLETLQSITAALGVKLQDLFKDL
jgi:transcriptional regulator with XRE-family HTH domain